MSQAAVVELAPTGVLRAAINLSNFLLVSGKSPAGEPEGVAPDMAREVAERLGVPVAYVTVRPPGRARRRRRHRGLGHRPDRRRAVARRDDRVHAGLCRDRGDLPRARGLAAPDHRRGRPPGRADRDRGPERLRPLAQPPPPARRAGARAEPRCLLRPVRRRPARRARRPSPPPAAGRREAPRRPHPRRQVHRGAAGGRHRQGQRGRRPLSSTTSSRRPRPRAWSRA